MRRSALAHRQPERVARPDRDGAARWGAAPAAKQFRLGTHRVASPAETLARVMKLAPAMGITRLATLTGLDYIGIPVCAATRPNALSISVCQGKGLSLEAAAASALMEAAEMFHAEAVDHRARRASLDAMRAAGLRVAAEGLPRTKKKLARDVAIPWIEAESVADGSPVWVPLEMVSTDYRLTRVPGSGCFAVSTNGLASGNHPCEALVAGICEVVERDASALWTARGLAGRVQRVLDLASVDDKACIDLLQRLERARMSVTVWDMTSDIGVAAFHCRIGEAESNKRRSLGAFSGFGCHPDRGVALARALTEAAQARLTLIAGARDDLAPDDYESPAGLDVWEALLTLRSNSTRDFRSVPHYASDDVAEDVAWLMERLAAAGFGEVLVVDLTRPDFGLPVLRVLVPGLEGPYGHKDIVPGPRVASVRA